MATSPPGFWQHPDYPEVLVPDHVTSPVSMDGYNKI